jgi:hypothetical protein
MIYLLVPLLLGSPGVRETPGPPAAVIVTDEQALDQLTTEYEAALAAWKKALKATEDRAEKRALRKEKPAIDFYPRFEALADSGEGRALLWMIENAKNAGNKSSQAKALRSRLAGQLVSKHMAEPWFGDAVPVLFKNKSSLGMERLEELSLKIVETCPSDIVQAQTLAKLASLMSRSSAEEEQARGKSYFERLEEEYSEEVLAMALTGARFRETFLRAGRVAPDFEAETVDGEKFRLSDYRGKVTLIDFWGFW